MKKVVLTGFTIVLLLVGAITSCAPAPTQPAPTASTPTQPAPTASSPAPTTAAPKPTPSTSTPTKTLNLFFGSTTSTSGAYTFVVAQARLVNKYAKGVRVTVVESGATYDNLRKMREGVFQGSFLGNWNSNWEMTKGLPPFEGKSWDKLRAYFLRDTLALRAYVRADSGIKSWSDLAGKKVSAGIPGSGGAEDLVRINKTLGIGANIIPGNLDDAVDDLQSGRLDMVFKSSPPKTFDAALMAVNVRTPLTVIGFNSEQAAKLVAANPTMVPNVTPSGTIDLLSKLGDVVELNTIATPTMTSLIPQDVGYELTKAVVGHWDELVKLYPPVAGIDPIMDYVKRVPKGREIFLHAGTVQYAKEVGLAIPANLIPPEYQPK